MDGWFPRFFRTRFVLFVRVEKAGYLVKSSSFKFIDGAKDVDAWHRKMECNHGVQQLQVSADVVRLIFGLSIRKIMWHLSEEPHNRVFCMVKVLGTFCQCYGDVFVQSRGIITGLGLSCASRPSLCTRRMVLFVLSRCDIHHWHPNQFSILMVGKRSITL